MNGLFYLNPSPPAPKGGVAEEVLQNCSLFYFDFYNSKKLNLFILFDKDSPFGGRGATTNTPLSTF